MATFLPFQIGFLEYPQGIDVIVDLYLDTVFLLEIISLFNKPFYDSNSRLITDRKVIAKQYLSSWFVLDVLACLPYSYIKMKSEFTPRSKDDFKNLYSLNFNSVPRFYKIMQCIKFVRIRKVQEMLHFCLKKTALRSQT